MRLSVVFSVFVFCIFSVVTMLYLKTDVAGLYDRRDFLLSEQAMLREHIRVQQAELAYLTSPMRLEALAGKAGMVAVDARQVYQSNFLSSGY
ncbi:MAG: hypothetical protein VXY83_03630 [Pseudomonadota bacterium]|nr:hypothetical protein [Magnetococcales bacterium]MEC8066359.1 hypothetical protein [Pseudomonadota bacterium]MEC8467428.1 hypothetical protein [Pseudomonadota bacterium]|tara:strand:- start:11371 stop:11646 length:276 start_codon:yes stop_codon:yes gene_type:complete